MRIMQNLFKFLNAVLAEAGQPAVDLRGKMLVPCPFCRGESTTREPHSSLFQFPRTGEPGVKVFGEHCSAGAKAFNALALVEHFLGVTSAREKVERLKAICAAERIDPAALGVKAREFAPRKAAGAGTAEKRVAKAAESLDAETAAAVARDYAAAFAEKHAPQGGGRYTPTDFGKITLCPGGVRDTRHCEAVKLETFLADVKRGKWKKTVLAVRSTADKRERDRLKNSCLPTIAPWGVYRERNADGLQTLSGFFVVDFDGKDNPGKDAAALRDALGELPFVAGAFLSPSGNGVKAILRVRDELDRRANTELAARLLAPQGWRMDMQGSQWLQASFDPDAVVPARPLREIRPMKESFDDYSDAELVLLFRPVLERYWFSGEGGFIKKNGNEWQKIKTSELKEDLQIAGVPDRRRIIALVVWLRENRFVARVEEALSAHKAGIYETERGKLIVQTSPHLPTPAKGEWPTIDAILHAMFDDPDHPRQIDTVFAHLQRCFRNAYDRIERGIFEGNQPYFGVIGERDCGKSSLFLDLIVTPLLGGRATDAKDALMTETKFNDEISGSEILIIDDAAEAKREMLNAFAANIKRYCYNRALKMEGKGKDSFTIRKFFFAVFQVMNADGECVNAAPTLTDDVRDKVCFYYAKRFRPLPAAKPGEDVNAFKAETAARIAAEIPAFAYYLLNEFMPEESVLADDPMDRNGFRLWIHPYCEQRLLEESFARDMLDALDNAFDNDRDSYCTAFSALRLASRAGFDRISARKAGRALTELARTIPSRVKKIERDNQGFYIIADPRRPGKFDKDLLPVDL